MDPLNPALQSRVWSRVMAAPACREAQPCQSCQHCPQPLPSPPPVCDSPPIADTPTILPASVQTNGHTRCCQPNWPPLLLALLLLGR